MILPATNISINHIDSCLSNLENANNKPANMSMQFLEIPYAKHTIHESISTSFRISGD